MLNAIDVLLSQEQGKAAADHVGALYNLGRMTRGRGTSESKALVTANIC